MGAASPRLRGEHGFAHALRRKKVLKDIFKQKSEVTSGPIHKFGQIKKPMQYAQALLFVNSI